MLERYGWLFLAVAFMWILQLMLSLFQTKRFYGKYHELKRDGDTSAIGIAGSNWKLKVYAILVVDGDRKIVHAGKLSGFTVFAGMKKVEGLEGRHLSELEQDGVGGLNKKLLTAFRNAAEFIHNHDRKQEFREDALSNESVV